MEASHFFHLPEEIQVHILSNLSINDKFRLKIVCKRFEYLLCIVLKYQTHLWLIDKSPDYPRTHHAGRSYCLIIAYLDETEDLLEFLKMLFPHLPKLSALTFKVDARGEKCLPQIRQLIRDHYSCTLKCLRLRCLGLTELDPVPGLRYGLNSLQHLEMENTFGYLPRFDDLKLQSLTCTHSPEEDKSILPAGLKIVNLTSRSVGFKFSVLSKCASTLQYLKLILEHPSSLQPNITFPLLRELHVSFEKNIWADEEFKLFDFLAFSRHSPLLTTLTVSSEFVEEFEEDISPKLNKFLSYLPRLKRITIFSQGRCPSERKLIVSMGPVKTGVEHFEKSFEPEVYCEICGRV